MATAKGKIEVQDSGVDVAPKGDREARWEKFLANYAQKNPVKFASKKKNGEFDKIPESFQ